MMNVIVNKSKSHTVAKDWFYYMILHNFDIQYYVIVVTGIYVILAPELHDFVTKQLCNE